MTAGVTGGNEGGGGERVVCGVERQSSKNEQCAYWQEKVHTI